MSGLDLSQKLNLGYNPLEGATRHQPRTTGQSWRAGSGPKISLGLLQGSVLVHELEYGGPPGSLSRQGLGRKDLSFEGRP